MTNEFASEPLSTSVAECECISNQEIENARYTWIIKNLYYLQLMQSFSIKTSTKIIQKFVQNKRIFASLFHPSTSINFIVTFRVKVLWNIIA